MSITRRSFIRGVGAAAVAIPASAVAAKAVLEAPNTSPNPDWQAALKSPEWIAFKNGQIREDELKVLLAQAQGACNPSVTVRKVGGATFVPADGTWAVRGGKVWVAVES